MASNIRIIQARDFIIATPDGQLDFEKSKKVLMEVAAASAPLVDYGIILDTRTTQSEMPMPMVDLYNLALELSNFRKAFSNKTAVLCPLERFDDAGFFALCAQNRGFPVKAFTSFEDAVGWLIA